MELVWVMVWDGWRLAGLDDVMVKGGERCGGSFVIGCVRVLNAGGI
jgi:hypothetical protein